MRFITDTIPVLNARLARGETSCEALVAGALRPRPARPAAVFTTLYPDARWPRPAMPMRPAPAGVAQPPLAGLPVSLKDLYDVAGETTLAGSVVCRGEPPARADARPWRGCARPARLAGQDHDRVRLLGRGHQPAPRHAAQPGRRGAGPHPGGSSSGAAVSVALAWRWPAWARTPAARSAFLAALCGLVGFKSTQSRVPRQGALELSRSLDTVCAMARSVADCLSVDAVLAGAALRCAAARWPACAWPCRRPCCSTSSSPRWRPRAGAHAAVGRRRATGRDPAGRAGRDPASERARWFFAGRGLCRAPPAPGPARERFDPRVAARIELGAAVTAREYLAMQDARADWIARVEARWRALTPCSAPPCPCWRPRSRRQAGS
jgi:aspartyl-tRNA(Asn)/glutamyl-tRNA(Gln) amidotransferase subunit A